MAYNNPRYFEGLCPKCGLQVDYLETCRNDDGEKVQKYFCDNCDIKIVINDESDEVEECYGA